MPEGSSTPENWYSIIPPEGSDKVGRTVFNILADIIKDKEHIGLTKRWQRNYELVRGQHWRKNTSIMGVSLVTANLINTWISRTVNLLTDNNPIFDVAKYGSSDEVQEEAYAAMQHTAEHWWIDQEQQSKLERSVYNGEMNGIAIEKVLFNPDIEYGTGDVETVIVDPYQFGWYPLDLVDPMDLQKSECVLYYFRMPVREVRRRWPQYAELIHGDKELMEDLGEDRRELKTANTPGSLMTTIGGAVREVMNWFSSTGTDDDKTLVVECWAHDYTMATDAATGMTQPKYTGFIRRIICCNAGRVVLEDQDNPNINPTIPREAAMRSYLYDKFPFVAVNSVPDPASAWGLSSIEQLEGINMEVDKSLSQFVLIKDKAARLKIINPKTSGIQNHEFTNYPGILNPVNNMEAQGIRYLEMPQLPVDIQAAVQMFVDMFYKVSGIFDIEQAKSTGSQVIASKAIAALLENNSVMMKGKIRAYSALIRERGRMFLSLMQNFYTDTRTITIRAEDGSQQTMAINGSEMLFPAKLTVVTGSTMPVSKIQQREEAIALYKAGAIDVEDLLNKMDWGSRTDVIRRQKQGPYGALLEKLQSTGAPEGFTQYIGEIAMMDDKQFARAAEQGKVPPFSAVLGAMVREVQQNGQPEPSPDDEKTYADIRKTMAEVEKTDAERDLTLEKIVTERVEQNVRVAGIRYDEEMLKVERAKIVADIQRTREHEAVKWADSIPGYQEHGLKTNNKEDLTYE